MAQPWNIYAESLMYLGHGYALWNPDIAVSPRSPNGGRWDIDVGDVGWFHNGSFRPFLRTTATTVEDQPHALLPDEYEPFSPPARSIRRNPESIAHRTLFSRSIEDVDGGVSLKGLLTGAGIAPEDLTFKSTDNKAALGMLHSKAEETSVECRQEIIDYLRRNVDKWEKLANYSDPTKASFDLKLEDLTFVTGVTKAVCWTVAAFEGADDRPEKNTVSSGISDCTCAPDMKHGITELSANDMYYETGPRSPWYFDRTALHPGNRASSTAKADQCIFIHYYKMERRVPPSQPAHFAAGRGLHGLLHPSPHIGKVGPTSQDQLSNNLIQASEAEVKTRDPPVCVLGAPEWFILTSYDSSLTP
ncbi:hypothetical protein BV20DRAFT_946026 [Pilatotrama ljubarskyi]|nr:hypothetical protein BV20DRAFT_946026 [Pilatotrama ljubarskyi]